MRQRCGNCGGDVVVIEGVVVCGFCMGVWRDF